ncbi:hypothetical protein QJS66_10940 [Kocuria rhizophila]|nr:hypothetical protein QJS66_10940 [Kocuria rhizophila]
MNAETMGGDYKMENHVTGLDPNKLIAWKPCPEGTSVEDNGWEWMYELQPEGSDSTTVTRTEPAGDDATPRWRIRSASRSSTRTSWRSPWTSPPRPSRVPRHSREPLPRTAVKHGARALPREGAGAVVLGCAGDAARSPPGPGRRRPGVAWRGPGEHGMSTRCPVEDRRRAEGGFEHGIVAHSVAGLREGQLGVPADPRGAAVCGVASLAQLYSVQGAPILAEDLHVDAAQSALAVSAATMGLAVGAIPVPGLRLVGATSHDGRRGERGHRARCARWGSCPRSSSRGPALRGGRGLGGIPAVAMAYLAEEVSSRHGAVAAVLTSPERVSAGSPAGSWPTLADFFGWRVGTLAIAAAAAVVFILSAPRQRGFTAQPSRSRASTDCSTTRGRTSRTPPPDPLPAGLSWPMAGLWPSTPDIGFHLGRSRSTRRRPWCPCRPLAHLSARGPLPGPWGLAGASAESPCCWLGPVMLGGLPAAHRRAVAAGGRGGAARVTAGFAAHSVANGAVRPRHGGSGAGVLAVHAVDHGDRRCSATRWASRSPPRGGTVVLCILGSSSRPGPHEPSCPRAAASCR